MPFELEYEEELETAPVSPKAPARPPAAIPKEQLSARITVVGKASRRWTAAKDQTDAARLNLALSQQRAANIRAAVQRILKKELPSVPIQVDSKGIGSTQASLLPRENNLATDRSAVVTLNLTVTNSTMRFVGPPRPWRVYAPSKYWEVSVVALNRAVGGVAIVFLRIVLKNLITGKRAVFTGKLAGGGMSSDVFDFDVHSNPGNIGKQIGDSVTFSTPEAMRFADFDGQIVRVGRAEAKVLVGSDLTYLTFPLLHTGMLVFDSHLLKLGYGLEGFVVAGKIRLEGMDPGDFFEIPGIPDLVPVQDKSTRADALMVTFPTGQAGLGDLTAKDRKRLLDFVTNKARNIRALLQSNYGYVK
jgi:hypothetical protein